MEETPTPKAESRTDFDFTIPFPSPAILTPQTSSTPHSPPSSHLPHNPMSGIFDPYSDALLQMSSPYVSSSRPNWKPSPPQSDMGPPPSHFGPSLPPHNIFYGSNQPNHHFPPPLEHDRLRPPAMLTLPPPTPFLDREYDELPLSYNNQQHYANQSPYETPSVMHPNSAGSAGSGGMLEYFPPYSTHSTPNVPHMPYSGAYSDFSPTYQDPPHHRPTAGLAPPSAPAPKGGKAQSKTTRQQFSACGACRHRRVKCDLKEQQDALDAREGAGPMRGRTKRKAICSNCEERGVACVDEYAPIKAAKQLRRGKRISEIEHLYGKSATGAAVAQAVEVGLVSPELKVEMAGLPELTQAFFESPFFRRFQVQHARDFTQRYLSHPRPCAAAMGTEGAILCHVLYAWALSYGVDENGQLDVPEGGGEPLGPLPLDHSTPNEVRRETDRQRRFQDMKVAVEVIMREIDECGIMRKPSWDGVRVLLLVLPLTEGISSSVERLSMYETALNQVYSLCSFAGVGYDGQPAGMSAVNGGSDNDGRHNVQMIRVRIYWYAFVHEGITTGLKGGRLLLDDEDLDTMHDSIQNRAVVVQNSTMQTSIKFATAPINLALACRLINRALTGPSARRSKSVNGTWVKEAWEALEKSWEEFEALKYDPDASVVYSTMDEVTRFADGWKIFLFEAQNVIRKILEERYAKLLAAREEAYISEPVNGTHSPGFGPERMSELTNLQRLLDISRSKCEAQCRQILDMVRRHAGSRFFEWDASLVRDGTFYAAKLLPRMGGAEDDIAVCLQALNELRWAHAKAPDRSAELRQEWANSRRDNSSPIFPKWEPDLSPPNAGQQRWDCNSYPPSRPSHIQDNSFTTSFGSSNSGSSLQSPLGSNFITSAHPGYMPLHIHQNPQHVYSESTMGLDPNRIPRGAAMDMSKAEWTSTGVDGIVDASQGYAVYGHIPGPPPLNAATGLGLGSLGSSQSPELGSGGYTDVPGEEYRMGQ